MGQSAALTAKAMMTARIVSLTILHLCLYMYWVFLVIRPFKELINWENTISLFSVRIFMETDALALLVR